MSQKSSVYLVITVFFANYFLNFSYNLLAAQFLGHENYGDLSVTMGTVALLTVISLLGLHNFALKQITLYHKNKQHALLKGLLLHGLGLSLVLSLLIGGAVFGIYDQWFSPHRNINHPIYMAWMILPLMVSCSFLFKSMTALSLKWRALLPFMGLQPLLLILFFYGWHTTYGQLTTREAMLAIALSFLVVLILFLIFLSRELTNHVIKVRSAFQSKSWTRQALPFWIPSIALVGLNQSGIIMMESLAKNESDVGIYSAIIQTAGLFVILVKALKLVAIPQFSVFLEQNKKTDLIKRLRQFQIIILTSYALGVAIFLVFGAQILTWFGTNTIKGYPAFMILLAGNFFIMIYGLALPLLQILKQDKIVLGSMLVMLAIDLLLGLILIPFYGTLGGALAFAISAFLVGSFEVYWLQRRLGIAYLPFIKEKACPETIPSKP